ncbi:hypothetical protein K503DRAFT_868100 [Rhizopogon vinicolor AM-OR11-026]|uniref:Uncharacterized protein n=1 Tax=Rhizopogon vinicolor AM-OR11-026 TaxID=1314800 RepID=A0A1B7MSS1_9AGAM|nr:hypothetical protein K503DRAFT_868100 [Rhizopogon vinicolor AM-OR11-026]
MVPSLYRPIAELWLIAIEAKGRHGLEWDSSLRSSSSFHGKLGCRLHAGPTFCNNYASAALKYVKSIRSRAQNPDITLDMLIVTLANSVDLIMRTGEHSAAIREEYILRQSIKNVFLALRVIQRLLRATGSMDHPLRQRLSSIFHYFSTDSTTSDDANDAVSVFYQALRSHALETTVGMDPSRPLSPEVDINGWITHILAILVQYIVYDKILTYALKHLDTLSRVLDPMARQDETLRKHWCILEQYIGFYAGLRSNEEMKRKSSPNKRGGFYVVIMRLRMTLSSCNVRDDRWHATAQNSTSAAVGDYFRYFTARGFTDYLFRLIGAALRET